MDQPVMETTGSDNAGGAGGSNTYQSHQTIYDLVYPGSHQDEPYAHNLNTLTNVALSLHYQSINEPQLSSVEVRNAVQQLENYEPLRPISTKGQEIVSNGVDFSVQPIVIEDLPFKRADETDSDSDFELKIKKKKKTPQPKVIKIRKPKPPSNGPRFTLQQRVFVLQQYWKQGRDYSAIRDAFMKKFDGAEPPTRSSIRNLNSKFEKEGTVIDRARSGRPTSVTSEQKIEEVRQYLETNKDYPKSTRNACKELQISKTSLLRILKKCGLKLSNDHDYSKNGKEKEKEKEKQEDKEKEKESTK